ncbi:MAG: hypothetical protein HY283_09760 [Nitrospirae bacterium]|nr:hypothetical protein [Nitrospirota bacterium]
MPNEQRQQAQRRQAPRGYGPSRRKSPTGLFFGPEHRRFQRRHKDRRGLFRRVEDQPEEGFLLSL